MPIYPAPVLEIINGSTTINLLARGKGWHLTGFRPRTAELKNGGTWQSSPLSNGRQPVSYRYDNIIDTWTVSADGYDEDGIIELAQELERAGADALDYWSADWTSTPVYIRARGPHETNTRYAIIHQIRVPEYADQYRQPMFNIDEPVMDGLSIIIEHGQWQNVAPGSQECVEISSAFELDLTAWVTSTTAPSTDVTAIIQLPTGRILANDNGGAIVYSDDNGDNWASISGLGTGNINDLAYSEGYVYAVSSLDTDDVFYRSTDNGNGWTEINVSSGGVLLDTAFQVEAWAGGQVRVAGSDGSTHYIMRSSDYGSTWAVQYSGATTILLLRKLQSAYLLFAEGVNLLRMGISSSTATIVFTASNPISSITQATNGRIFVADEGGNVYKSDDSGGAAGTWSLLWSGVLTAAPTYVYAVSDGRLFAGVPSLLYESDDNGATWSLNTTSLSDYPYAFLLASSGTLFASSGQDILTYVPDPTVMGPTSCDNEVYVSNARRNTNLTHIRYYDASATTYTDLLPIGNTDTNILPAVPAAGDILYLGINTSATIETGPFSAVAFNLASPFVGWTDVEWEYWNGSAWSALTVVDKTLSLLQAGANSVVWIPPSGWATTAVDGITGYWIRFRVVSVATSPSPAVQTGGKQIYAIVNPYVEIAAAQVGGDIPALARIRVENVSDLDGPGGSAPDLYSNRVILGLRSYDRGALFTAFLNAADEQNPVGVTVTAGSDTSFAGAIGAPSGRLAQWSPAGTGSWVTILTFSLAATIATQYYGTFRVFLRARQSGGTAGQMTLRLRTSTGSGGVSITSETKTFANTNDFQILDFGQLTIPLSAYLKATELGDTLTIAVQGNTSSTTPDCNMYDLVLIPVDEWAADLTDGENSASSALASGYYLDVDSVSFPKRQLRNAVKATGTGYTKAIWQQVANGPAILQANARQRLWLLSMRTASAGSSDWRSEPDVVHRVQMWSAERYRWARGSR